MNTQHHHQRWLIFVLFSEPKDSPYFEMNKEVDSVKITDVIFTEKDIIDAIDELKNSSASGPDGLSAIFLKRCKTALAKPLCCPWRKCLD